MNTEFIEFLAKSGAIKFGEFTLKSGRLSPYFINTGVLSDGETTYELARHYAKLIYETYQSNFDAIYGPAYKGIPLAVAISIALFKEHQIIKPWIFDRKEKKIHGDVSGFVGGSIDHNARVIIVDDVLTTGGTKVEAIEKIKNGLRANSISIVIAVDRMEKGNKDGAIEEFTAQTGVPVYSITKIKDVFEHLKNTSISGKTYVDADLYKQFIEYRKKYGTPLL
ncbi:orotate phosphoribosyltransferase [Candidatus Micrarchaeota archaeon]|nr:orotate phosphoribosyltransferase [Candidatus Micrarchaeota archaeon]